jgi:hypothetical protein
MKMIKSVLKSLARSPVKSVLTLITVSLGVGVLILAVSVSSYLSRILSRELSQEGIVVTFANSEFNDEGELERVMPPQVDGNITNVVRSEVVGVDAIAPIAFTFWNEVKAGEHTYRIRNAVGTTEEYDDVMGYDFVAGSFFSKEDVENGTRVAVISRSLAELLFGSTEAAIGAAIHPPARGQFMRQGGGQQYGDRRPTIQTFTVGGIFSDLGELKRRSYAAADLVIPYTAMLPAGTNIERVQRFLLSRRHQHRAGTTLPSLNPDYEGSGDQFRLCGITAP